MFSFFRKTFRQWARSGTRAVAPKAPLPRLQCEALEDRVVLSVTTPETTINSTKSGVQYQPASATASNGSSVVVWTEIKSSTDSDIKAQRFDASGRKVGGEITVATGRNPQHHASVAVDASGGFVVVWTQDFSTSDKDVYGAIFRSDGVRVGNQFTVADTPTNEFDPNVGRAANGDFVVTYTYQYGSKDNDIKAIQYRATGSVIRTFDVSSSTRSEDKSQVAVAPDGRFAVVYQSVGNIYLTRYTSLGSKLGSHSVATASVTEMNADVGMDGKGNVYVVWQQQNGADWNVYGRMISATGLVSNTWNVATSSSAIESLPAIAVDAASGKSVVVFHSQVGSTISTLVSEWTESRTWVRTSRAGYGLTAPSAGIGGSARRFVVATQSIGRHADDYDGGVFALFGTL